MTMDQYSQHNLKIAATEPEHVVRKAEFDSVTDSIRLEYALKEEVRDLADSVADGMDGKLSKAGGVMTGDLVLPDYSSLKTGADPSRDLLPDACLYTMAFTASASSVVVGATFHYFTDGTMKTFDNAIPMVSTESSGIFPANDYAEFVTYGNRIVALESRGGVLIDSYATYADFQAAQTPIPSYVKASDWCRILADEQQGGAQTQYFVKDADGTLSWVYGGEIGQNTVYGIANQTNLGLVLSSNNRQPESGQVEGPDDGAVFVESNGVGQLVGYSRMIARIGTAENQIVSFNAALNTKAPINNPAFTGLATSPVVRVNYSSASGEKGGLALSHNSGLQPANQIYMANATFAAAGVTGTLKPASGVEVTGWSIHFNAQASSPSYGFIWEANASPTATTADWLAELSSVSGNFRTKGKVYANSTEELVSQTSGKFTPTLTGTASGPPTPINVNGSYVKTGKQVLVLVSISVEVPVNSRPSGGVKITGLPYSPVGQFGIGSVSSYIGLNVKPLVCIAGTDGSIFIHSAVDGSVFDWSEVNNTTVGFRLAVTYITN